MFAILGPIQFRLITYFEGTESRQSYDYAVHEIIDGKPLLQSMGDGLKEIKIDMTFHAAYCMPELEMARLRIAASSRAAMPLVYGSGNYEGMFVIERIRSLTRHTDRSGGLIALTAEVNLKEAAGSGIGQVGAIASAVTALARASTAAGTMSAAAPSPRPDNDPEAVPSTAITRA